MKKLRTAEGGKSGAIIFFTFSQEFVIKSISRAEKKVLFKILHRYIERIEYSKSRLARIIGVFQLKPINQDFIIMENIVSNSQNAVIFDIKGSLLDRFVQGNFDYFEPPYGRVLKDINLHESGFKFHISPTEKEKIINELNKDFEMLATFGIMDYSVLIAFYRSGIKSKTRYDISGIEDVYSIGIIDFLQIYNIKKKSENYFKKMIFRNTEISSEKPKIYRERISSSMSDLLENRSSMNLTRGLSLL